MHESVDEHVVYELDGARSSENKALRNLYFIRVERSLGRRSCSSVSSVPSWFRWVCRCQTPPQLSLCRCLLVAVSFNNTLVVLLLRLLSPFTCG